MIGGLLISAALDACESHGGAANFPAGCKEGIMLFALGACAPLPFAQRRGERGERRRLARLAGWSSWSARRIGRARVGGQVRTPLAR